MPSLKINIVKTLGQQEKCLESIMRKAKYKNCSITIIANVKIHVLSIAKAIDKARK